MRGQAQRLVAHLERGDGHGIAARHQRAAREGAGAPVEAAGVAGDDRDVGGIAAERIRGDLGERRLVALPVRGEAGGDEDLAARLDADARAFIRPDARALDVAGDAEAEMAAVGARGGLARAEVAVADHGQRHVEAGRVVAAVVAGRPAVLEGEAHVPRELVGLDQVAAADLDRLDPQLARDEPDDALHHEGAVRPAGAAVRRHLHLVRVDHVELDVIVAEPVRPGELGRGDQRHDEAVRRVGARVVQEPVAQAQDAAVLVDGDLDVVELTALLTRRQQVLDAVLDPLDGPAQAHRRARHQDLLGIEQHDLRAEGAADVGRDHLHLELGQAEDPREPVLDRQRRLGRDPRLERPRARVELGHDAAGLDGAAAAPLDPQPLAEHAGGAGKGGIRIAHALHEPARAIGGHVRVHQRRPVGERGFQLGDGGQRLVAHLDQLGGVLGDVAVLRDHERDHLTHVADAVGGERPLGAGLR